MDTYQQALMMFERTRKTGDAVLIANAENTFKGCKTEKDALEIFKKDLGTFVRFYEFMSQIVDYDDLELEKLCLFARKLRPLLRDTNIQEEDLNLNNVVLSHYRLSKLREQDLAMESDSPEYLDTGEGAGFAKAKDPREEFLSHIISRLNKLFITDGLSDKDLVNFAQSVADKVSENERAMSQVRSNSREQAMLGDFAKAVDDAVIDSNESNRNQMMQLLSNPDKAKTFSSLIYDLIAASAIEQKSLDERRQG